MPELTREEKLKLLEKLPQRLQDFLYSEDTGAFLLYIGQKYNLADEKVSALSKIVADVILKITPITSLAQEIASKVIPDSQTAMAMAQELNNELLAPVLTPAPATPPISIYQPAAPQPQPVPSAPAPSPKPVAIAPTVPQADRYREPTIGGPARQWPEPQAMAGGPEIVDLRKAPPPSPKPLTFTKPIEPLKPAPPLIEAEPHLPARISPKVPEVSADRIVPPQILTEKSTSDLPRPQYIIRPPGLAPTDLPHDVLDLRKDKGEF